MENHNYCVILAGGIGTRLWPMSRKSRPKQFIDIFGTGRTLLQETYERFARFMPHDNIYVSTNIGYMPYVYEQLPKIDDEHILEEPLNRGTLACAAWATVYIKKKDPQANLIIVPSDQLIINEDKFQDDVRRAFRFVSEGNRMMVMGIRPTRPETGYGYVQKSDKTAEENIYQLKTFTEKPQRQFAEIFIQDDSFLWNTGIFMYNADAMLDNLYRLVPEYQVEIPKMMADAENADSKFLPGFFNELPKLSIDMHIMEKSDNVYVYESQFGWADLGTWGTIGDYQLTDLDDNLLLDSHALLSDCKHNVIRLPKGRTAVIHGLEGYVVAEEGDVLMICPKEDLATIRRMMTEAQTQLGIE